MVPSVSRAHSNSSENSGSESVPTFRYTRTVDPSAPMGNLELLVSNSPTSRSRLPSPLKSHSAGAARPCFSVSTGLSPAITRNGAPSFGAPGISAGLSFRKLISSAWTTPKPMTAVTANRELLRTLFSPHMKDVGAPRGETRDAPHGDILKARCLQLPVQIDEQHLPARVPTAGVVGQAAPQDGRGRFENVAPAPRTGTFSRLAAYSSQFRSTNSTCPRASQWRAS